MKRYQDKYTRTGEKKLVRERERERRKETLNRCIHSINNLIKEDMENNNEKK